MGIISNTGITPGYILRKVLERAQTSAFFRVMVFSDEIGFSKPHRLMFETALKELDAHPSEAIHIGDGLRTDIAGAKAIGMKAIWIKNEETTTSGLYMPDYEVSTLPQVITILSLQASLD